jgi:hypothetical protein
MEDFLMAREEVQRLQHMFAFVATCGSTREKQPLLVVTGAPYAKGAHKLTISQSSGAFCIYTPTHTQGEFHRVPN